jgi:hypothetical protein
MHISLSPGSLNSCMLALSLLLLLLLPSCPRCSRPAGSATVQSRQ